MKCVEVSVERDNHEKNETGGIIHQVEKLKRRAEVKSSAVGLRVEFGE